MEKTFHSTSDGIVCLLPPMKRGVGAPFLASGALRLFLRIHRCAKRDAPSATAHFSFIYLFFFVSSLFLAAKQNLSSPKRVLEVIQRRRFSSFKEIGICVIEIAGNDVSMYCF
ncbi:hypothetical protein CEXT_134861 [Caerostris extrusa]|uniref:Uncharacterized protein n=1 Tax=Caerostris extrusa TaxID=172846 RepID=A0AAV4Q357_CAEEX|nr:hypothetical protein CEXT_134861 [Caerostris extrusa]